MRLGGILSPTQISASGLAAERRRLEVVANNIANAYTTRSLGGGPYRRQQVVFTEALDQARVSDPNSVHSLQGVRISGIQPDFSEFPMIHDPGHPDADADGYVLMPNVNVPHEMVDMITASRAYEANLKALMTYREMMEQTLSLLRGIG